MKKFKTAIRIARQATHGQGTNFTGVASVRPSLHGHLRRFICPRLAAIGHRCSQIDNMDDTLGGHLKRWGMPDFPVGKDKAAALARRMEELGILEEDLQEDFVRSRGAGGQHVNKTSTCVMLTHIPTGTSVRCEDERSQALNRYRARQRLVERIEEEILGEQSRRQQEIEKLRRQKRKRSKRAKEKVLADKHHRSDVKSARKAPDMPRE